jgi:tetratricopeptide (TPR) repeat protein
MSRAQGPTKARTEGRRKLNAKAAPRTGPLLIGKSLNAALCVLLAAAAIALYRPVIGHSFLVMDDRDYVTDNPYIHAGLIHNGLVWRTIKWAFTSTYAANWHPLTWLSHALDYQLFALNPAGHHLDSVLIHALNAVLLFLLLQWVTKRVGPSLLVAALFALHPINVESVAWVAERKNVLSTLFFFLAIAAYVRYAQKPDWRRYLLVAGMFAAGLMAKPMVITLPFVLLLLDYWPLCRTSTDGTMSPPGASNGVPRMTVPVLLTEKVPLLFLSAVSAVITVKAQGNAVRSLYQFPLGARIENAALAYGLYLWKMIWPARLAFYPYPVNGFPAWQWILSALVLVVITALVIAFRRKRYLPVGWFWFLGTLVPVIGLVQVGEASMADRYAYVPLIGIFVMIAFGLADVAEAKAVRRVWCIVPALGALTALSFATSRQMSYWESDYDLWSHTLANAESPLAHNFIGGALLDPDAQMTQRDRDNVGTEQQRLVNARQHIESALKTYRQLTEKNPDAYRYYLGVVLNNVGGVDQRQHHLDEARQHFQEALELYRQLAQQDPDTQLPNVATTLNNVGIADQLGNRLDEATSYFESAIKIYRQLAAQKPDQYLPRLAMTLNGLGNLVASQSRLDEAREDFEDALKIYRKLAEQNPDAQLPYMASTLSNLGVVDQLQNRIKESRAYFAESLTIYRRLAQDDPARYADDVAQAEASLEELEKTVPSR